MAANKRIDAKQIKAAIYAAAEIKAKRVEFDGSKLIVIISDEQPGTACLEDFTFDHENNHDEAA